MTHEELWRQALNEIEINLTRANFITWFKQTAVANVQEGVVTLSVPNGFAKEWLKSKYHKFILRAIRNINNDVKDVDYVIGQYKPVESEHRRPSHEKRRWTEPVHGSELNEEFAL